MISIRVVIPGVSSTRRTTLPESDTPERTIRRWQTDFFHQFILAGVWRRLRVRRRADGREVLRLFDVPEVRRLGVSLRWLPVRAAFTAATAGARKKTS